jgi:hypothetical protein
MNGPLANYGGGAGGSAEMGDAQTMAAVKNVRSISRITSCSTSSRDLGLGGSDERGLGLE